MVTGKFDKEFVAPNKRYLLKQASAKKANTQPTNDTNHAKDGRK